MSDLLLYGWILYCGGQFAVFIVKIIHGYQSDSEHTATSNVGAQLGMTFHHQQTYSSSWETHFMGWPGNLDTIATGTAADKHDCHPCRHLHLSEIIYPQ